MNLKNCSIKQSTSTRYRHHINLFAQFPFKLFYGIEDDGAAAIVQQGTGQAVAETGLVQVGKFAAIRKTMGIDGTLIVCQKMAGNGV